MSFILLEREAMPFRLRGRRVVPATAVPLGVGPLLPGAYLGFSGVRAELLGGVGLLADAVPEAKAAYAVMRAAGVTLDEAVLDAPDGEVFVREGEARVVEKASGSRPAEGTWPAELMGYWIPSDFYSGEQLLGAGWLRVTPEVVEAITVDASLDARASVKVLPRYASDLVYNCHSFERTARRVLRQYGKYGEN